MIELHEQPTYLPLPGGPQKKAVCQIDFQRTLRIRMTTGSIPPVWVDFPVEHVDDFADKLAR